jgi:type IV pilus biogenesis protein CpaD/CtpE
MKTWRTRKAAPAVAALAVAAGVLLAGCSSGDGSTTQAPSAPSPIVSTVKVTDMALGEALDKLAFQGTGSSRKDGGACLVL